MDKKDMLPLNQEMKYTCIERIPNLQVVWGGDKPLGNPHQIDSEINTIPPNEFGVWYWSYMDEDQSADFLVGLNPDDVKRAITEGMQVWASVVGLTVKYINKHNITGIKPHFQICFGGEKHCDCPFDFDGSSEEGGSVLAHAFFPNSPNFRGQQHYCGEENWGIFNIRGGIDIATVVFHEAGHALGIGHLPPELQGETGARDNIMFPSYSGRKVTLGPWDKAQFLARYGKYAVKVQSKGLFQKIWAWFKNWASKLGR